MLSLDDEICSFIDKAETKLKNSKVLFEVWGYSDSVSLSYYCMFLCAKALLVKKNCKMVETEHYEHEFYKHCDEKDADAIAWAFVNKEKLVKCLKEAL